MIRYMANTLHCALLHASLRDFETALHLIIHKYMVVGISNTHHTRMIHNTHNRINEMILDDDQ